MVQIGARWVGTDLAEQPGTPGPPVNRRPGLLKAVAEPEREPAVGFLQLARLDRPGQWIMLMA